MCQQDVGSAYQQDAVCCFSARGTSAVASWFAQVEKLSVPGVPGFHLSIVV